MTPSERKEPKPKKCKVCANIFIPVRPLQKVCCSTCAYKFATEQAKAKREKDMRKEHKEAKERIKTRSDWMKEAQAAVNAYCRARDLIAGYNCICCGKPFEPQRPGGSIDAGHFLSRGSHPELRFEEKNIHAQRKSCNRPGGTTAASFRKGMIDRVGLEVVQWLESRHEPRKYTVDDLKNIRNTYRKKLRELKNSSDNA